VRLAYAAAAALRGGNWVGSRAAAFTDERVRALLLPPPAKPIEELAGAWGWKTAALLRLAEEAEALVSLA
jgi:hypothetical protein